MVRVRIELTTLALLAPRSAYWANGPLVPKRTFHSVWSRLIMATRGFEDMKKCFGLCSTWKHRAARARKTTGNHEVKAELFH